MTAERSAALLEQLIALRQEAEASPARRTRLLVWVQRIEAELDMRKSSRPSMRPTFAS
jgi:hypothetical protein